MRQPPFYGGCIYFWKGYMHVIGVCLYRLISGAYTYKKLEGSCYLWRYVEKEFILIPFLEVLLILAGLFISPQFQSQIIYLVQEVQIQEGK